jgi:hypothetical protein
VKRRGAITAAAVVSARGVFACAGTSSLLYGKRIHTEINEIGDDIRL